MASCRWEFGLGVALTVCSELYCTFTVVYALTFENRSSEL